MVYLFQILCSVVFLGMTGLLSGENLWLNMISPVIYGRTFDASAPDFPESFSDGLIGGWLPLWLAEKDRALLSGNSYAELYPSDSILAVSYTHLDVYKRQRWAHRERRCFGRRSSETGRNFGAICAAIIRKTDGCIW